MKNSFAVSVIVPIYHGRKYIPDIIRQLEKCRRKMAVEMQLELLFISDDPDECLEDFRSDLIEIKVFNTTVNRGIQAARIKGIGLSRGGYILMLDQDDKISECFMESQLKNIMEHDADASVCRAIRENRPVYDSQVIFENVTDLDFTLEKGCFIASPGQVLIKKSAVPAVWKENILQKNGADDWMLWICMLSEGKKFVLNDDILYEHVETGVNASWDTIRMHESEMELCGILERAGALSDTQMDTLKKTVNDKWLTQIRLLDKFRKIFCLYDKWMALNVQGKNISRYLGEKGIHKVCVYGVGYIGKMLINELNHTGITVLCAFDRNAEYLDRIGAKVLKQAEPVENAGLYIVTLVEDYEKFCGELADKVNAPVIPIADLLEKIERWQPKQG